jgi:histidine phosphotransferase ChpT
VDWAVETPALNKPSARALLNLAQLGATALPIGGTAKLIAREEPGMMRLELDAKGSRARLRVEAVDGLEGRPFGEGLAGQWVQTYFLRSIVDQAGGTLVFETGEDQVRVNIDLPLE